MKKTNIDHLRDILKELEYVDSEKGSEAIEFLDAIESEMNDKDRQIREAKIEEDLKEDEEVEYDNSDFVGLDTIQWKLDNGNLKIQQQVESFIQRLQKENAVVPA